MSHRISKHLEVRQKYGRVQNIPVHFPIFLWDRGVPLDMDASETWDSTKCPCYDLTEKSKIDGPGPSKIERTVHEPLTQKCSSCRIKSCIVLSWAACSLQLQPDVSQNPRFINKDHWYALLLAHVSMFRDISWVSVVSLYCSVLAVSFLWYVRATIYYG